MTDQASGARNDSSDDEETSKEESSMDWLQKIFLQKMKLKDTEKKKPEQILDDVNFDGIVKYISSDKCKNVIVMVGAGISTSAGIPDFRSPSSGIYANLQKYDLPSPEAMFEINFFRENPEPFFHLAKELFPGKFKPTVSHYFLRLLQDKGLLLRLYTQNIDTLERVAGIPSEKMVEAHGTFYTSHCLNSACYTEYSLEWMKQQIFSSDTVPSCTQCNEVVKPDIVFFGERLPERFFDCIKEDFKKCDLLLIIGTSLTVQPFAGLIDSVAETTPRLLINKEKRGQSNPFFEMLGFGDGLNFDVDSNYRDVAWIGLCDDGCLELADKLGWKNELKSLVEKEHKKIDEKDETEK